LTHLSVIFLFFVTSLSALKKTHRQMEVLDTYIQLIVAGERTRSDITITRFQDNGRHRRYTFTYRPANRTFLLAITEPCSLLELDHRDGSFEWNREYDVDTFTTLLHTKLSQGWELGRAPHSGVQSASAARTSDRHRFVPRMRQV
jgi:hypothetical protein